MKVLILALILLDVVTLALMAFVRIPGQLKTGPLFLTPHRGLIVDVLAFATDNPRSSHICSGLRTCMHTRIFVVALSRSYVYVYTVVFHTMQYCSTKPKHALGNHRPKDNACLPEVSIQEVYNEDANESAFGLPPRRAKFTTEKRHGTAKTNSQPRKDTELADLCGSELSAAPRGNLLTFVDRSSAQRRAETC